MVAVRALAGFRPALLAVWIALALAAGAADAPARVVVHLEIHDELTDSGLRVTLRKDAAVGSNALDFLEGAVAVRYRRYPGMGVFVTELCGVAAPAGTFWALSINGEPSMRGIADIDLGADTRIRWELVPLG